MDEIKMYFFTIFKVFLLLSSIFIILTIIKYLRDKNKNKKINNLNMRCSRGISKQIENKNKDNSYKVIDKYSTNEKVYKYNNGDLYKGEFVNGKRQGFGICLFSNKEKYEGIWKDDLMHSIGKYTYNNGCTYSGDFRNGVAEGIGTYTYKNNDIYKGHFLNNKKEGKGVLYYKDGSKYIGMWKDNLKCGNGKLIKSNGDIYIGEFSNDKINGKGEYIYSNGDKYTGEFKDNVFHGHGCYINSIGDIYEGEYRYGLKKGYGTLKTVDGIIYEGEFKDDLFEGNGRFKYKNEEIYEGDFKRGERDVIGTCICGLYKYIGEWKNNKKGKIGTYYLSSKVIIDIVIENDILNGIYKINDEEKYINNIDLNVIEEKDMLENIEKYLNDNINHHNYS